MVPILKITPSRPDLQNRIIRRPDNNQVCHRGTFFDNSHSPFIILDANLDFVDINQVALLLIYKEREEVIGKNLTEIFPDSINSKRIELYKEVIRTGKGINVDHLTLKAKNFNYIVSLRVFKIDEGLGISIQETTELVNAIDQLEKTKSKLQQMNHSLSVRNDELEEFSYVAAHDLKAPLTNVATLLELLKDDSKTNLADHAIFQKLESVSKLMCERINALNQVIALKSNLGKNPKEHKSLTSSKK